ncbi:NAD(P)/FAD-dependent oxidoreductase [Curtobacterium ammoniigenes]|uniref:NAD(P)/FAD-dependent oxidoreductase n=1 Tax=Curtobacterium ammoniigenes TaxID=395387 RepID=UPI000832796A|nr:FAD/NAD(P)-binding oxidoreductase [Curtobacterium ammoniigenes]
MSDYTYLIIGGGMAADAAARGIREIDADGRIGILSADMDPPYARPALSKKLWTDPDFSWPDQVDLHTADDTGADIRLQTVVTAIDRDAHVVATAGSDRFGYEKLLIATGGRPRSLPGLEPSDRVIAYRSAHDYRRVRELAAAHATIAVVGGGYIGSEMASALAQNNAQVTFITPTERVGAQMFPRDLAEAFHQHFVDAGVDVRAGRRVVDASEGAEDVTLTLDDGTTVRAAAVVVGFGIDPIDDLAAAAGLAVDDGVIVDDRLRTADPDIFAAGDIAHYPDMLLGERRVEHVDNAQHQGRQAGRNLAGANEPYAYTPMYYSDVFDMGYEAVGRLDASLETVEDWADPTKQGVVYYLDDGVVCGVLLWNVWDKTDNARQVIAEANALTADDLPGTIPFD